MSATLNQDRRPVPFHSCTLHGSCTIHLLRKSCFLLASYCKLITDKQPVAFMYDNKSSNKINNDKIMRWRVASRDIYIIIVETVTMIQIPLLCEKCSNKL